MCADQWLLGPCQNEHTRWGSIGDELDQGPTCKVEASEPCIGHFDRPSDEQFTQNFFVCWCSVRHRQIRVIGLRETIDPSRGSIGNCTGFLTAFDGPSRSFIAEYALQVLHDSPGHSWRQFWHFCGNCLGAPLETPFKTNWREGLFVAQFNFFSTAFDPRVSTMVLSWKEDSGHVPQLIIPENEGGDETNFHLRGNLPSSMIPMFLMDLVDLRHSWTSSTARSVWTSTRMGMASRIHHQVLEQPQIEFEVCVALVHEGMFTHAI